MKGAKKQMEKIRKELGNIEEGVLWAELSLTLDQHWADVRKVSLDKHQYHEKAEYYYLLSTEKQSGSGEFTLYLVIEVYNSSDYVYNIPDPFSQYITRFHNFILVGYEQCFHYIDLFTFESKRFPDHEIEWVDGRVHCCRGHFWDFEDFYEIEDCLIVSDCMDLYCFDKNCSLVWKTKKHVGHEGISIIGYKNGFLEVRGEDIPHYYFISSVDMKTGEVELISTTPYPDESLDEV